MKKRSPFRQVTALVAAAALWLAALPWSALAAQESYWKLTDPEALATGQYVLVGADGMAPLCLDTETGWLTAAQPVVEADAITDPAGALWSLTVAAGGILLQDANGVFLAPGSQGRLLSAEYYWHVTWNGDGFSFHGTVEDVPVTLVRHQDTGYRVMEDALIEAYPEGFPSTFALYTQPATTLPGETTVPTTEETTQPAAEPTTVPVTQSTEPPIPAGEYVLWSETHGTALSSCRASAQSQDYSGTAVTLSDGVLTGYSAAEVWSLAWEGDRCILCSNGEILGTQPDYAGISYGTGDNRWLLEPQAGGYLVRNAASGLYVRYAADFSLWTSANTAADATLLQFTPAQSVPEPTIPPETEPTEPIQATTGPVVPSPASGPLFPGSVTLTCQTSGATIYYATSSNGVTYSAYAPYQGPIPLNAGFGVCYLKAYAQVPGSLPGAEILACYTEQTAKGRGLYFGRLHTHSGVSDLAASAEAVFAAAAQTENLDFLAITDHSDSFTNGTSGQLTLDGSAISPEWAAGKIAAQAATTRDFVGIYGYEMSWPQGQQLGHISTFSTPGFQTRDQQPYETLSTALPNYYDALAAVPGAIGMFNHPGSLYGTFQDFAHYTKARDEVLHLVELGTGAEACTQYIRALDQGWHLAPAGSSGESCRTVVLAEALTEAGIYDAIRSHRVYATEDPDLSITCTANGYPLGSRLKASDLGSTLTLDILVTDPTDGSLCQAAVITQGGRVLEEKLLSGGAGTFTLSPEPGYYFLRVTQPDGSIAVTAPFWVESSAADAGILAFTADNTQPELGQAVTLTLTLYNRESTALTINGLTLTVNGEAVPVSAALSQVAGGSTGSCAIPLTWAGAGNAEVRVQVSAAMAGQTQTCEASLTLHYARKEAETSLLSIAEARKSEAGTPCILRGYVTAGNSDPYNTFPNTLYLQDATGGIAVTGITGTAIEIGTPLEVQGTITQENGNPVLELLTFQVTEGDRYRYVAASLPFGESMNLFLHGGELLKVEGRVVSVTPQGATGVARFVLEDDSGNRATVDIGSTIFSGSTGRNDLSYVVKTGRTVRATGILYAAPDGTPALRVRNCDEVVYVPTLPYASQSGSNGSNPSTGDPISPFLFLLPVTVCLLLPLFRRKTRFPL